MLKLLTRFNKKEIILSLICLVFIISQVWLDLKLPDYMSEITKLVQTEGSTINEIIVQGAYMLACAGRKPNISLYCTDTLHHTLQHHFLKN